MLGGALLSGLALVLVMLAWRAADRRLERTTWASLVERAGPPAGVFEASLVDGLPEPARRFFLHAIRPGTPLYRAVEIGMTGELGLGTREQPSYRPMSAQQLLAPPHGLVWKLDAGPIAGSDGATPQTSWTRFWLFGVIPIARAGGDADHHRSAFGRVVAEAAFWAPASLLPGPSVRWEAVNGSTARAVVTLGALQQAVDITVGQGGAPSQVSILRWSNENPERAFREQPFGGELSEFEDFGGYRLPTRVEGGNHFGTPDYFPFFKARVTKIHFPGSDAP